VEPVCDVFNITHCVNVVRYRTNHTVLLVFTSAN